MEEILSNIIAVSIKKENDDVENEQEIVNLMENLANVMKDLISQDVIRRILTTDVLKAFNVFDSP